MANWLQKLQSRKFLLAKVLKVEMALDALVEKLKGLKPLENPTEIPPHRRGRPRKQAGETTKDPLATPSEPTTIDPAFFQPETT